MNGYNLLLSLSTTDDPVHVTIEAPDLTTLTQHIRQTYGGDVCLLRTVLVASWPIPQCMSQPVDSGA